MKSNKLVVIFLLKFFGTYLLLFLSYSFYLQQTQQITDGFSCAPITQTVAKQTNFLLNKFGYDAEIEQHPDELSIKQTMNGYYISRIVEGCSSISIIILFCSFIVAFSNKFIPTALYILVGSFIIYATNIFRIVFINIAIYKYPKYESYLHDLVFPSIIYGITFLLWFIWIRKFSKKYE